MDNSQNSAKEDAGKDKPVKNDTHNDGSGGYYYDDATGYEIYDDRDDDAEEEGDSNSET